MDEQQTIHDEFSIVELEPREAPAPDAFFYGGGFGSGGSGGYGGGWGGWGGSGGGSGT